MNVFMSDFTRNDIQGKRFCKTTLLSLMSLFNFSSIIMYIASNCYQPNKEIEYKKYNFQQGFA